MVRTFSNKAKSLNAVLTLPFSVKNYAVDVGYATRNDWLKPV